MVQSISPQSCALDSNCTSQLNGAYMEQVAFVLIAQGNLSAEGNFTADLASLPAVDPDDLIGSESLTSDWAALHGYLVVYSLLDDGVLEPNSTSLSAALPAFNSTGYHRLLVVPIVGAVYNLTSWIYVVSVPCTTLLALDGECAADCPDGCFCTGDGRCWPEPGWWSTGEHSAPISCVLPASCPGSLQVAANSDSPSPVLNADGSRNTERCAADYMGTVCGVCDVDYYHDGAACRYCGSTTSQQVGTFVGLLIAAAVIAAAVATVIAVSSPFALAARVSTLMALQHVVLIGQTASPLLPSRYDWLSQVFTDVSMLNLDVSMFHPGCVIAALSYVDVFWATLAIAVGAAALLVLAATTRAWLVLWAVSGNQQNWLQRVWVKRVPQESDEGQQTLQLVDLEDWTDPSGTKNVRQQRLARHRVVLSFIFSWPSKVRADLVEGFELGRSARLRWWPMARARAFQAVLVGASLAYLRVTTVILQLLQCTSIQNDAGTASLLVLEVDKRTLCYQGGHLAAAVVAWMLLVVYSIGFPVVVLWLLKGAHSMERVGKQLSDLNISQATVSPQHGESSSRPSDVLSAEVSSPVDPYADHRSVSGWDVKDDSNEPSATASEYEARTATPTVDRGRRTLTVDTKTRGDTPTSSRAAKKSPVDPALALIKLRAEALSPRFVQSRVSAGALSDDEAAALDGDYMLHCTEVVLLSRFARFGYLLSGLRSDSVYAFAIAPLVINFALACLVVLPDTLYVSTFVSSLTFVVRCVVVALVWPFASWKSNVGSMAGNAGLVLQALVALGIVQALSLSQGSVDANSAAALSLQQRLAQEVVYFLKHNLTFIGVLVALLCALVVSAALAAIVRGRGRRGEQKTLEPYSAATSSSRADKPSVSHGAASSYAGSVDDKHTAVEMASLGKQVDGDDSSSRATFRLTRDSSSPAAHAQQQQQRPDLPPRPARDAPSLPDRPASHSQQQPPAAGATYPYTDTPAAGGAADPYAAAPADPYADAPVLPTAADPYNAEPRDVYAAPSDPYASSADPYSDTPVPPYAPSDGTSLSREQLLAMVVLKQRAAQRAMQQ